jgi:hypothetical protein
LDGFGGCGGVFHFAGAKDLAMGTIAANFGAGDEDFETEVGFDLFAEAGEGLAEKLFDFAAAEANDVGVFLLEAGFVVVLVAAVVHEVEFIDESAVLEHFQRAVDGDAIELGILSLGETKEFLGIEVFSGTID